MKWYGDFEQHLAAKTAHMFLFHGNVSDDILFKGEFLRIHQLIPRMDSLKPAGIIAFFNLATGVRFPNEE
ncbi:MAG: hypothetical protein Q8L57_01965, partial [bacterium]|nr:hypothetical protein [bacterium]